MDTIFSFSLAQNLLPFCHLTCENVVVVHFHSTAWSNAIVYCRWSNGQYPSHSHDVTQHPRWNGCTNETAMTTYLSHFEFHIVTWRYIRCVFSHIKNEFRQSRENSAINDCPIAIDRETKWNWPTSRWNRGKTKGNGQRQSPVSTRLIHTNYISIVLYLVLAPSLPSAFISPIDFN